MAPPAGWTLPGEATSALYAAGGGVLDKQCRRRALGGPGFVRGGGTLSPWAGGFTVSTFALTSADSLVTGTEP
jgi:hypothetical protein